MYGLNNKLWLGVKNLFNQLSWQRVLAFSLFVVISAILWFTIIYKEKFETNVTIPIKYISIPDSIVFHDSLPSTIRIRLRDDGLAMFKYYFLKNDTLYLDVATLINGGTNKILQGSTYEQAIRSSLPYSTQILNYTPLRISFNYSKLKYKKVPVVFDGQINLAPGYFLSNDISLMPDSVMAYGSKTDLDKLIFAYTTNDNINGVDRSNVYEFKIMQHSNIKFTPNTVKVNVPVEAYIAKQVEIPVNCLNLPDDLLIKFLPSKITLSFFVGISKADSIKVDDFSAAVDYDALKDLKNPSTPVRIISAPEYIKNLTINPSDVEFVFQHKN